MKKITISIILLILIGAIVTVFYKSKKIEVPTQINKETNQNEESTVQDQVSRDIIQNIELTPPEKNIENKLDPNITVKKIETPTKLETAKNSVKIISPQQGEWFNAGETITIKISTDASVDKILLFGVPRERNYAKPGDGNLMINKEIQEGIHSFEYTIPEDVFDPIGFILTGFDMDKEQNRSTLDNISINIHPNSTITGINFADEMMITFVNGVMPATIMVTRSNGMMYQLTEHENVTYEIENTNIADHYCSGLIKGIKPGKTKLTVTYEGISISTPLEVLPSDYEITDLPNVCE